MAQNPELHDEHRSDSSRAVATRAPVLIQRQPALAEVDASTEGLTFAEWLAETLLRWRIIAATIGVMAVVSALALLLLPPVYTSRTSFVAHSTTASRLPSALSGASALAGLGGLAAQLGVSTGTDPSESPSFYVELIQSRELLTRLLQSRFPDPRTESARDSAMLVDMLRIRERDPRRKLEKGIKKITKAIQAGYDNTTDLVWIDVDAQWPELSAAVANRAIELVNAFNTEQRVSHVRSRRVFLEGRVILARSDMERAEARHRDFLEQNRQWRSSPTLVSEEQELQRDVDGRSELYEQLQRQLETTLLEEVNDVPRITVVDAAIPPRLARWPRYGILAGSTLLTGLILGFIIAGASAVLAHWRALNPASANRLTAAATTMRREILGAFRRAAREPA